MLTEMFLYILFIYGIHALCPHEHIAPGDKMSPVSPVSNFYNKNSDDRYQNIVFSVTHKF